MFLWGNPDTTERDLHSPDGGFAWVKQRFEWRNIEKTKGSFEWYEPDRIVDAIDKAGLKVIARVDNQPEWAAHDPAWPGTGPPDKLEDWKDFLTALAERYKGRIQAYEIWNEPNLAREWGDTAARPGGVRQHAQGRATRRSRRPIRNALVISAGMSPTTDNSEHAIPDLRVHPRDVRRRRKGLLRHAGRPRGRASRPSRAPTRPTVAPDPS